MKIIRIVVSLLVLLILIALFVVVSFYLFINPDKLKPVIINQIQKHSGFVVDIPEHLHWSFYPRFSVQADRLTLTAPLKNSPFADLTDVKIVVPLSQLFNKVESSLGEIFIQKALLNHIIITKAHLVLDWQSDRLQLKLLSAQSYEGHLEGQLQASGLSTLPSWHWTFFFTDFQVQPFLEALGKSKLKVAGIANLKWDGTSTGKNYVQLVSGMNGHLSLGIRNGSLQGLDLNYLVMTADALINKQSSNNTSDMGQTNFDSFVATAIINQGIVTTNDLKIVTKALTVNGQGLINLLAQTIDLKLQIATQKNIKTQWMIPVLVKGDLAAPNVALDQSLIEKWLATQEMDKVKSKIEEKVNELLPKANQFLQRILK